MIDKIKKITGNQGMTDNCDTIVGLGSCMKGEITCKGPSRIAGRIEGDLKGDDRLVIAKEAIIVGQVSAVEIEIYGEIQGTINATNRIILNETAKIDGDLHSPSVVIEEGAVFNGKSHMPIENKNTKDQHKDNIHKIDITSQITEKTGTQD